MNEFFKSVAKFNLIKLIQWTWTLNEQNKQATKFIRCIHNKRSQFFLNIMKINFYYFENHQKLYLMNCLSINVCSWNWNLLNLKSFHYVIRILCHTQNTCWMAFFKGLKVWMCFLLLKCFPPNVFKFIMGFNILNKKGHMCWYFWVHMYWTLLKDVDSNFECF
jgi:hypothetical protein